MIFVNGGVDIAWDGHIEEGTSSRALAEELLRDDRAPGGGRDEGHRSPRKGLSELIAREEAL